MVASIAHFFQPFSIAHCALISAIDTKDPGATIVSLLPSSVILGVLVKAITRNAFPFSSLIFIMAADVVKTALKTAIAPPARKRLALFMACVGLAISSRRSSLNLYFFPATEMPPAALISCTASSMPLNTSCPYSAASPDSGPE